MFLSTNLRFLRETGGMNIGNLCAELNYAIEIAQLGQYENDASLWEVVDLVTLANFFKVTIDDLIRVDLREKVPVPDVKVYQPGDLVRLKSGGDALTVSKVSVPESKCEVYYWANGCICNIVLPFIAIQHF